MTESQHSIRIDPTRCVGCVDCSKACPTKAIRVREDLARIKPELCIDCGACIDSCRPEAIQARMSSTADLKRFRHAVAVPSMPLYGQFGSQVHPGQVLDALLKIGFDSTFDISYMYEMVGVATDAYLAECSGPWPKISVNCPAIVRLVQIRYPDLIPNLIPLETARELSAKMHRKRLSRELGIAPEEIGIFFISPCTAIMKSITDPVGIGHSYLDGALSIAELYGSLLKEMNGESGRHRDHPVSPRGILWGIPGGQLAMLRTASSMVVHGARDVQYLFDRIESGKFQGIDFIEAHICAGGCVSGQLAIENRFAAQRNLQRIQRGLEGQDRIKEERIRTLARDRFFNLEEGIAARPFKPTPDLREAVAMRREREEILARLPGKDCAACGAPDCRTFADDVLRGESVTEDCLFVKLRALEGTRATSKEEI